MFISGNGETGVPELNLASIPYIGSPEGLRHFWEYGFVESLTLLSQRLNARGGEGKGGRHVLK